MKKNLLNILGLGSILLVGSSIISRFLGIFRDVVFARLFGSGTEGGLFALDAYYLAFRIPDFLYTLLVLGALSSAFIPLYTKFKKENLEEANVFVNTVLSTLFLSLLCFSFIVFFLVPFFLPVLAPGFSQENIDLAISLTRILLISPFFMGMSGLLQGIENVHKRFLGMALAPIIYNLSIICSALFFAKTYGVYALAFGVLIGAFLHFLIQIPGVIASSYKFRFAWPKFTPEIRELLRLGLPRILGIAAMQVTLFVDFALASLLTFGSISIYSYALNIQSFPYGVIGVSLAAAIFPILSEQALDSEKKAFVLSFKKTFAQIWFWIVPATCGLFFIREPLITIFLQGGAFTEMDAAYTASIFSILVWSVLGLSLVPLLSRTFYALSDTKTPVLIALFTMLLNIILSILLSVIMDLNLIGIALANVFASSFNALFLLVILSKKLKRSIFELIEWKRFLKIIFATFLMMLGLILLNEISFQNIFAQVLILSSGGGFIYLAFFGFKISHKS